MRCRTPQNIPGIQPVFSDHFIRELCRLGILPYLTMIVSGRTDVLVKTDVLKL